MLETEYFHVAATLLAHDAVEIAVLEAESPRFHRLDVILGKLKEDRIRVIRRELHFAVVSDTAETGLAFEKGFQLHQYQVLPIPERCVLKWREHNPLQLMHRLDAAVGKQETHGGRRGSR